MKIDKCVHVTSESPEEFNKLSQLGLTWIPSGGFGTKYWQVTFVIEGNDEDILAKLKELRT